jgi:hypothetical protein
MAHMREAIDHGREDTDAMRWGRLVLMAVLELPKLLALPAWPGGRRVGKAWDDFAVGVGTGDYLMPDDADRLQLISCACSRRLASLPPIVATERALTWTDPQCGESQAHIDAVLTGGSWLELKTCGRINKDAFLWQAKTLGYHMQLGWYWHGAELAGIRGNVWVLAVESKPPHATALYQVPSGVLERGYTEAVEIAQRWRVAEACGVYSGPYDDVTLQYEIPQGYDDGEVDMTEVEL